MLSRRYSTPSVGKVDISHAGKKKPSRLPHLFLVFRSETHTSVMKKKNWHRSCRFELSCSCFCSLRWFIMRTAGKEHCEMQKTTSVGWDAGIQSLDHRQHAHIDSTFFLFLLPSIHLNSHPSVAYINEIRINSTLPYSISTS